MKVESNTIKVLILIMVIVLDTYLLNLNINIIHENSDKEIKSTANYVDAKVLSKTVEQETKVYDNLTLDELSLKLDKSLNSTLSGKGYLIASYSLEKGVDPYMATAIILQETGCSWECSYIVKQCNNVGGQKGSGCGSYTYYSTLDEGIIGFIDNLYLNFVSKGLTTPELINPSYAADQTWSTKINNYINKIKSN